MNKENKEIARKYFKDISKIEKEFEEKDKEIERLKEELQDTKEHLGEYLYEQEEENKRLNNIIKELEEYFKLNIETKNNEPVFLSNIMEMNRVVRLNVFKENLDKLQELKGSE